MGGSCSNTSTLGDSEKNKIKDNSILDKIETKPEPEQNPRQKKKLKLSKEEQALLDCKFCRDKIKNYIKSIENTISIKKNKALSSLKSKDKEKAKLYLKQCKFHQEKLKSTEGQLVLIEQQIAEITQATQMVEITKTLDKGNEIIKDLQNQVNIEKFQEVKDTLDELKQRDDEISNFFKEQGIESQINEDIDAQLAAFEEEFKKENQQSLLQLPDPLKNEEPKEKESKKEKILIE